MSRDKNIAQLIYKTNKSLPLLTAEMSGQTWVEMMGQTWAV